MDVVQKRKHQPIENTVNMQLNCLIGATADHVANLFKKASFPSCRENPGLMRRMFSPKLWRKVLPLDIFNKYVNFIHGMADYLL